MRLFVLLFIISNSLQRSLRSYKECFVPYRFISTINERWYVTKQNLFLCKLICTWWMNFTILPTNVSLSLIIRSELIISKCSYTTIRLIIKISLLFNQIRLRKEQIFTFMVLLTRSEFCSAVDSIFLHKTCESLVVNVCRFHFIK